jgi:hypothetical protein
VSERWVQFPSRIDPSFLLRVGGRHGSSGRVPQRQLLSWMEVKRPAQSPRLHELAALPERVADVLLRDPFDTRGELQLRRRLNLCVDAAGFVHDLDEPVRACAPGE